MSGKDTWIIADDMIREHEIDEMRSYPEKARHPMDWDYIPVASDYFKAEEFLNRPEVKGYDIVFDYMKEWGMPRVSVMRTHVGFTWGNDKEVWSNNIYREGIVVSAGPWFGTLFDKINGKANIIRGMPKFFEEKEFSIEDNDKIFPYYDGVRITLFVFPEIDIFYGKTDRQEYIKRSASITTDFHAYLEESPNFSKLHDMVMKYGKDHAISGVCYGSELSSRELSLYKDAPHHNFIVTCIEDKTTHKFLEHNEVIRMCEEFGVDVVRETTIDSDIVKQTGGYLVQKYNDGEIMYHGVQNKEIEIDKMKAIINEVWECS